MQEPSLIKIYSVEFINPYDMDLINLNLDNRHMFLVEESDLAYYSKMGGGYSRIEYIGDMIIPSPSHLGRIE